MQYERQRGISPTVRGGALYYPCEMGELAVHDLETGGPDGPQRGAAGKPRAWSPVTPETVPSAPLEPADGALVERVRRGEGYAFDLLVRRHDRRAFGLAFRLLGHREDAEDVVQESFIAALEALDRFDATRPFGPWLYRIVVNRSLNARKSRSRRSTEQVPEDAPAATLSPERSAEWAETRRRVRDAMAALPERQRTVMTMIELEGFSGPEVAEVLGMPEGTVRWHLHSARKALRVALGSDDGGVE